MLEEIREIVGKNSVLTGNQVTARSYDPFRVAPLTAKAIVRPRTVEQLSQVMRLCYDYNQTIVVHGGLTGVTEATKTQEQDIVISLELMNSIVSICPINRVAVVEAGATLQRVEEAAIEKGMLFPLDIGARGTATIGGIIGTNAGGNQVIRWGMMRQLVLGLEVVLPDGTIVSSMNTLQKNNTGYDIKQLFIGAEGTLGIVTKAVLKLVPIPVSTNVALVATNSYENVIKLLNLVMSFPILSAFEVMWPEFYRIVTKAIPENKPLAENYNFYILIEMKGNSQEKEREELENFLSEMLERSIVEDAVLAHSQAQSKALWQIRESVECVAKDLSPMVGFDISVPVNAVETYLAEVERLLLADMPAARIVCFGHLGDNNIHLAVSSGKDTFENTEKIESIVYEPFRHIEGSVSAEHGIGLRKKNYLFKSRTANEIALMKTIKASLDPKHLLNPQVLF